MDKTIAILVFLILLPLLLIVSLLLLIYNSGDAFFTQLRPGKDERIFKLIKFKTMTDERDEYGKLLPDHLRLTKVGRFVRSTSLDELPQLVNVIKGDMSLVGPRPLLVKYLDRYTHRQRKRHQVKPGITGWAQVNGRNALSWAEKFEHDIYYVENQSFWLDLKILWLTVVKVLKRDGVSSASSATMEEFKG